MNAMTKIVAAVVMTGATSFVSLSASAWWDNDRRYDRWYGGPWYGGNPYWGGYRGWGGYHPGWGYPGYNRGSTIIVNPTGSEAESEPEPAPVPAYPLPE